MSVMPTFYFLLNPKYDKIYVMKKYLCIFSILIMGAHAAHADVDPRIREIYELTVIRDQLIRDIEQIDREKQRCERQRRGWTVATIVGGIGVATTATVGIMQHQRISAERETQRLLSPDNPTTEVVE